MDVHPTKNGINRYWSIPISSHQLTAESRGWEPCKLRSPTAKICPAVSLAVLNWDSQVAPNLVHLMAWVVQRQLDTVPSWNESHDHCEFWCSHSLTICCLSYLSQRYKILLMPMLVGTQPTSKYSKTCVLRQTSCLQWIWKQNDIWNLSQFHPNSVPRSASPPATLQGWVL